jgi:hypothetical protein
MFYYWLCKVFFFNNLSILSVLLLWLNLFPRFDPNDGAWKNGLLSGGLNPGPLSHESSVSLVVSTVKTNLDRDFSICWEQLLKIVENVQPVKINFFYFSLEIFKIKTFQSRLSCVEIFIKIVETNQDNQDFGDLSRLFKIFWISCTFCPFWSQFWSTKCKQKRLKSRTRYL